MTCSITNTCSINTNFLPFPPTHGPTGFCFENEAFIRNNSDEGVRQFIAWHELHPEYQWSTTDSSGRNIAVAALCNGNAALLDYALAHDPTLLNALSCGFTPFDSLMNDVKDSRNKNNLPNIKDVVECVKIAVTAGVVVYRPGQIAPLNTFIDEIEKFKGDMDSQDFVDRITRYAVPIIKILIISGVQYDGVQQRYKYGVGGFFPAYKMQLGGYWVLDCINYGESELIKKAKQEIENDWQKERLLYIAQQKDLNSPFSAVPYELITLIHSKIPSLPEKDSNSADFKATIINNLNQIWEKFKSLFD